MTREEAIKGLKVLRKDFSGYKPNEEMFDMAIKALEQEPCEDAVSRQEVFEQINCWIGDGEYRYTNATDYLNKRIKALSPVTPKEKTGRWIRKVAEIENDDLRITYECSECKVEQLFKENYCPDCGARMFDEVSK